MKKQTKKTVSSRFFICSQGSITDLEEIYSISQPLPGYDKYEDQWRFRAVSRLDGKSLDFIYDSRDECAKDQHRMALQLIDHKDGWWSDTE